LINPTKILNDKLHYSYKKAKDHVCEKIELYRKKIDDVNKLLIANDTMMMLDQGFIVLTKKNGEIIKQPENMFNKKMIMITSTGRYDVIIKKA
jgi:exonuclease VII large subunit